MKPLRILMNGSRGRMGQTIITCAKEDPELSVSAEIDEGDDFAAAIIGCDAVIDFTHHTVVESALNACVAHGKILIIGTTGHSDPEIAKITTASASIPIVFAPNFSVGVNTLFWLTKKAAEVLGPEFDLEIVEMHHRLKKDAPSGTAKKLAEILAEARSLQYKDDVRHGRAGIVGERTNAEIGMHAVRGGDVVGDHTVIFAGAGERVELTHKASSRETFARGALRAAKWARAQSPGLYDMQDVLGLK
ncbi:MAG: 4-hydroxy-tetrahydrodipicolinate reductase [Chthoniobacter sp.]|jgi:4-hydroxy-tetrahydrodipicolinate reductase|nr:4-hydroxy-tetrahydrodipicolinate reductase [Chthoniobacter sp.]